VAGSARPSFLPSAVSMVAKHTAQQLVLMDTTAPLRASSCAAQAHVPSFFMVLAHCLPHGLALPLLWMHPPSMLATVSAATNGNNHTTPLQHFQSRHAHL